MSAPVNGARAAAFFDLDKTILATSSSMALREPLVKAGLLTRREMAIGMLIHVPYLIAGADDERMEKMKVSLGEMTAGWDARLLEATVQDALETSIDPVCYTEALDLISLHHAAGLDVVVASASPIEMVRPIARLLGADHAIGTIAEKDDDGILTGEVLVYNYGEEKARGCAELAARRGWDMADCFAYSDSVSDVPLLESVGHPGAVNPDADLKAIAHERGWQVLSFTHTARVRPSPARVAVPAAILGAGVAAASWVLWKASRKG